MSAKTKVYSMVPFTKGVECFFSLLSCGRDVLHLAPWTTGGRQEELIRFFFLEALHEQGTVTSQAEVPTSGEGEDFNLHAQCFGQLRESAFASIDFPKNSRWRMAFFTYHVIHIGMKFVQLGLRVGDQRLPAFHWHWRPLVLTGFFHAGRCALQ